MRESTTRLPPLSTEDPTTGNAMKHLHSANFQNRKQHATCISSTQ